MLELDDLLTGYLEQQYEAAGKAEKEAFHALLELPDPELMGYLLNLKQPSSKPIGNVVKHILDRDISA